MKSVWLILLILSTSACSGIAPLDTNRQGEPRLLSLTPKSLGGNLAVSQLVTGEFNQRIYRMRFEVEVTPERLAIVGLSPMGITLFTLVQEQGKLPIVTQGRQKPAFDPRHILLDIHLTYWPREALQTALAAWSMRLVEHADGSVRRIVGLTGERIAEITYAPEEPRTNRIIIQHFDIPYRLLIQSRQAG